MVNVKNFERLPARVRAKWFHRENVRWKEINKFLEQYPDSYGWLRKHSAERDEDLRVLELGVTELDPLRGVKRLDVDNEGEL